MKTLVVFSCYDSSLSHVIFILKSNFGTGTGTETPEKNCGHFRNSPPPDLQQTQGTWSSHGWCRRWGPNLPTDPGRVGFVYRTSVGWFGNPKANHRLDGPKTLEKYMGYLPQNKWDKLPYINWFFPDFWTIQQFEQKLQPRSRIQEDVAIAVPWLFLQQNPSSRKCHDNVDGRNPAYQLIW